jgi:hypothetical protein
MPRLLLLAVAVLLGLAPAAGAQPPDRVARVGVLNVGAAAGSAARPQAARLLPALVEGLRERGWVEGKNLVLDWRFADWQPERLAELAGALVTARVDVIVVSGPAPMAAARAATRTIPIVMVASTIDPVRDGLVQSLAHPGGNVTGLTLGVSTGLAGKQLELLKEAVPGVRRVRIVWDVDPERVSGFTRAFEEAGPCLGLEVQPPTRIVHHRFIDQLFGDLVKARTQAVMFGPAPEAPPLPPGARRPPALPSGSRRRQAPAARSRRTYFWILPVEVLGSGPKTTCFGTLKCARFARHHAMIAPASTGSAPGLRVTKAQGVSPHVGSGRATTAASITAGWR